MPSLVLVVALLMALGVGFVIGRTTTQEPTGVVTGGAAVRTIDQGLAALDARSLPALGAAFTNDAVLTVHIPALSVNQEFHGAVQIRMLAVAIGNVNVARLSDVIHQGRLYSATLTSSYGSAVGVFELRGNQIARVWLVVDQPASA